MDLGSDTVRFYDRSADQQMKFVEHFMGQSLIMLDQSIVAEVVPSALDEQVTGENGEAI